jgi:hypothetical protein
VYGVNYLQADFLAIAAQPQGIQKSSEILFKIKSNHLPKYDLKRNQIAISQNDLKSKSNQIVLHSGKLFLSF